MAEDLRQRHVDRTDIPAKLRERDREERTEQEEVDGASHGRLRMSSAKRSIRDRRERPAPNVGCQRDAVQGSLAPGVDEAGERLGDGALVVGRRDDAGPGLAQERSGSPSSGTAARIGRPAARYSKILVVTTKRPRPSPSG